MSSPTTILLFVGALLVLNAECADYFSNPVGPIYALHDPYVFHSPAFNWRAQYRSDDDLDSAESREPLSPDYRDPRKPTASSKHPAGGGGGGGFDAAVLPSGVLDVDAADGFASAAAGLPGLVGGDFGFGLPRRPNPGGLFGFGSFFGPSLGDYQPWWKGSNVCIEREESTDDNDADDDEDADDGGGADGAKNDTGVEEVQNFFSTAISLSNCHQTPTKYECVTKINNHGVVKTFTVRYKCCFGYARAEGATGCGKRLELKTLPETLEQLEGKAFMEMVAMAGMRDEIDNGNYTVFMPTDQALEEFDDKMNDMNRVEMARRRRDAVSTPELVRAHLVAGFVDLHDVDNEQLLTTMNGNRTLRVNIYPTRTLDKLVTANCVRVRRANQLARNGVVHVLDGVMRPAGGDIATIVADHPQLTSLRRALAAADGSLDAILRRDGAHYTLFAPTDAAFERLAPTTLRKLLAGGGCAPTILRHHIVASTICASAILGNATTHNIAGDVLELERRDDGRLRVDDVAAITHADIIATNGVVHLIDAVIIPETALYLNDALKNNNMTTFQKLIEDADFLEEMNAFENATVFAPSDAALATPAARQQLADIGSDKERLRNLIRAHVVDGKLETCEMENNVFLDTLADEQHLRVNLYSTLPLFANIVNRATVNCARLTNFDEKSCGSIIHEVDRVLTPVNRTIFELLEHDDDFSTLRKIMHDTDLVEILNDTKRSISFAAPDNAAFAAVNDEDMKTLLEDKEKANMVLKNHILTEVLCCAGVGPQTWGFNNVVPTLAGQHQQVSRSGVRQVRIGRATVTRCDGMATNGVMHTVNRVLFPQRPHHPQLGFFFFDF